jgi:hypothetical protein
MTDDHPVLSGVEDAHASILDTLGGSDVVHVFAHSTASLGHVPGYTEREAELDHGVERALLLARPDDVVCVTRPVEPAYLEFLHGLGLGPNAGNVVVATAEHAPNRRATLPELLAKDERLLAAIRDRIGPACRVVLNSFIASPLEFRLAGVLARTLGRPVHVLGGKRGLLDQANSKHVVRAKAIELGVPVASGEMVELRPARDLAPLREALGRQLGPTGRAIVRGSHGVSGSAIFVVDGGPDSVDRALRQVARSADNTIYLVEAMLESVVSPNVLMDVESGAGRVRCVGVSDQRLHRDLAHKGNIYPTSARTTEGMIASAQKLCRWLQSEGFSGLAGFDFVESRHPATGRREQVLAELNARTNGAAYPTCAMQRLNAVAARRGRPGIGAFLSSHDLHTKLDCFAALRERFGSMLFDAGTGRGVLPYNTSGLPRGRLRAVSFGATRAEAEELHESFRLSISG